MSRERCFQRDSMSTAAVRGAGPASSTGRGIRIMSYRRSSWAASQPVTITSVFAFYEQENNDRARLPANTSNCLATTPTCQRSEIQLETADDGVKPHLCISRTEIMMSYLTHSARSADLPVRNRRQQQSGCSFSPIALASGFIRTSQPFCSPLN